jgi:hypothetical protein
MEPSRMHSRDVDAHQEQRLLQRVTKRARIDNETRSPKTDAELQQWLAQCTTESLDQWSEAVVQLLYAPCSYAIKYQALHLLVPHMANVSAMERRRIVDATSVFFAQIHLLPSLVARILAHADLSQIDCIVQILDVWLDQPLDNPPNKEVLHGAFDLLGKCTAVEIPDILRWNVIFTMRYDDDECLMQRALDTAQHLLHAHITLRHPWQPDHWASDIVTFISTTGTPALEQRRVLMAKHLISFPYKDECLPDAMQRPLLQVFADHNDAMMALFVVHYKRQMRISTVFRSYALTYSEMMQLCARHLTQSTVTDLVMIRIKSADTVEEVHEINPDQVALALSLDYKQATANFALQACNDMAQLVGALSDACTSRWIDFAMLFLKPGYGAVHGCATLAAHAIETVLSHQTFVFAPNQLATLRDILLTLLATHKSSFSSWSAKLLPALFCQPNEREQDMEAMALRACSVLAEALTTHNFVVVSKLVSKYLVHSSEHVCRAAFPLIHVLHASQPSISLSLLLPPTHEAIDKILLRARSECVDLLRIIDRHQLFMSDEDHLCLTHVITRVLQCSSHKSLLLDMVHPFASLLWRIFDQRMQHSNRYSTDSQRIISLTACQLVAVWERFPDCESFQVKAICALKRHCETNKHAQLIAHVHILNPCLRHLLNMPDMVQRMEATVNKNTSEFAEPLQAFNDTDRHRLDVANLLRDHIYGRVERIVLKNLLHRHMGAGRSYCLSSVLNPPSLLPHVFDPPDWFATRFSELIELADDGEIDARLMSDEEENNEEDEENNNNDNDDYDDDDDEDDYDEGDG